MHICFQHKVGRAFHDRKLAYLWLLLHSLPFCTEIFSPRSKLRCDVCNVGENPNPSVGGSVGGGGMNKPPLGKWSCEKCTVHNPDALFYCDACEHARPDLASMRF